MNLVREISEIVFSDGEYKTAEEKIIRVRKILLDALTENGNQEPLKFGSMTKGA